MATALPAEPCDREADEAADDICGRKKTKHDRTDDTTVEEADSWQVGTARPEALEQLYRSHSNVTHRLTPDYPLLRKLVTTG